MIEDLIKSQVFPPRKVFYSNPPLQDRPKIVPEEVDGVIKNKVIFEPQSNHSELESIDFDRETMSLRAKLNLGVNLRQVQLGQVENDPNYFNKVLLRFEHQIESQLANLESESVLSNGNSN